MLERKSALAGHLLGEPRLGTGRRTQLTLGEVHGWSLTQVAGYPSTFAAVERIVGELTGVATPAAAARPATSAGTIIFRTGHHQLWVVGADSTDFAAAVGARIDSSVGAVTPLSHSRTRIYIEGEPAAEVLKKGIALDFDGNFPVGAAALTGVHHMPIHLYRPTAARYEILALRTFAVAVFEWLADAALEFGYEIAEG